MDYSEIKSKMTNEELWVFYKNKKGELLGGKSSLKGKDLKDKEMILSAIITDIFEYKV